MSEPMAAWVEVWPLAADQNGIWLISGGDAWRAGPVPADGDPLFEAQLLAGNGIQTDLIHSTSWRVDGPRVILTWVLVAHCDNLVIEQWPNALPVTTKLHGTVGNPITHAANEPPTPRDIDVLFHAIRHLRFLRDTDTSARAIMDETWLRNLNDWEPVLAGLYSESHKAS